MRIKTNSNFLPIFTGTYENPFWEVRGFTDDGEQYDMEFNFKEYLASIAEYYDSARIDIARELHHFAPWVKAIKFDPKITSPREYNFSTDVLEFEIEFQFNGLRQALRTLKENPKWHQFLRDEFTSRSGFWSLTPNYHEAFEDMLRQRDDMERLLGVVLRFLIDEEACRLIEEDVADRWQGNDYGGLDRKPFNDHKARMKAHYDVPEYIHAFTYEADTHCPHHAVQRFGAKALNDGTAIDSEGNEVRPVFVWSTDDQDFPCHECAAEEIPF